MYFRLLINFKIIKIEVILRFDYYKHYQTIPNKNDFYKYLEQSDLGYMEHIL
jgi:hypothetical protein